MTELLTRSQRRIEVHLAAGAFQCDGWHTGPDVRPRHGRQGAPSGQSIRTVMMEDPDCACGWLKHTMHDSPVAFKAEGRHFLPAHLPAVTPVASFEADFDPADPMS